MKFPFLALLGLALLNACGGLPPPDVVAENNMPAILALGDSISAHAQQVLLKNVSAAMQAGGPDHAVAFCSTRAMPLTDSMAADHQVVLQRISDRNRNPANALVTDMDRQAWQRAGTDKSGFVQVDGDGTAWYYKPIHIGLPTCLKCHGGVEDMAPSTRAILEENYPDDKATGYAQGDLRGLWKIGFAALE
ncbi:MAG: DUF3365 domain-containing protein [Flavobacteriales bacterium]|nr:DUF3365 domain-containing protein [Flavobacteriales bacterium]MBP9080037.1 DUF3365 domain-containing protein [Flavobacteriales bacterium]